MSETDKDMGEQPPIGMGSNGELFDKPHKPKVYLKDGTVLTWDEAVERFGKEADETESE